METLIATVRSHPVLRHLNDAQVEFMAACAREARYESGAFLLREGGEAREWFLMISGRVVLEIHVPGRGSVQVETLHGGDILGWSWLFPPYRWHLDARAVESVRALVFDASAVRSRMESDYEFGYALARPMLWQLYQRLERVRMQRLDLYRREG